MLKISGLTTHYGSSQALFGVDLEFGTGEVATLLGRNGMGKTTTINSIMGIVRASGGSILFDGTELTGQRAFRIANLGIGLVPEGRQIFPNLTVRENLQMAARPGIDGDCEWTFERVMETFPRLSERLGLFRLAVLPSSTIPHL